MSAFTDLVADIDLAVMSELGGEPILYQPAVGDPVTVTGIFDAQYVLAQGDAEAGVEASGPAVFLRVAELPVDPELDEPTLTIDGRAYHVTQRKPDGIGGTVLLLRAVT